MTTGASSDTERLDSGRDDVDGAAGPLFDQLVRQGHFRSRARARYHFRSFFGDVSPADRDVLDIGAGRGWLSLYAGCRGARRVVGLEPEFDGSHSAVLAEFRESAERLDLRTVEGRNDPIQTYDPGEASFDLVCSAASINHLDEASCERLLHDPAARERYREVLGRIAGMTRPGGTLIVVNVSRANFFNAIGRRSPLASSIEWHKHQAPGVWIDLLGDVGFGEPRVTWWTSWVLDPLGPLVKNPLVAWFTYSRFRLQLTRV